MKLENLLLLYDAVFSAEVAFYAKKQNFFESLGDFSLWKEIKIDLSKYTILQKEILSQEIFNCFPNSVYKANKVGLANATEFFEILAKYPELINRNKQYLCHLLNDLMRRDERGLGDGVFYVSAEMAQTWMSRYITY